jgi:hypothetical protein
MATVGIGSNLGNSLSEVLMADDIEPGTEPSYQLCKVLWISHVLGEKIVEWPVRMAQSQERIIAVTDSVGDHAVVAFKEAWKEVGATVLIRQTRCIAKAYGAAVLVIGQAKGSPKKPLDLTKLGEGDIYFNCYDPLNVAGSLVLDQNPNSPDFLKKLGSLRVSGVEYHASRCCVVFNGQPIYLAYTSAAYGYVGRSVFQRILFPMKSFIQSMLTDDLVTIKAGVFIAKLKQPGSIVNRIMQSAANVKRLFVKESMTGNVISISTDGEEIETLNMQNTDVAMTTARKNIIENIAAGAPMPAKILNSETYAEGFGEGTEDAKDVARYIDGEREDMGAIYAFMDRIVQRRAWTPEFFERMQAIAPTVYPATMTYDQFFYKLSNSFTATWPSLLKEPDSEIAKKQKVQLEAIVSMVMVLNPLLDPENKVRVIMWAQDNINAWKELFPTNLDIDFDAMLAYAEQQAEQMNAMQEAAQEPQPGKPMGIEKADSVLMAAE